MKKAGKILFVVVVVAIALGAAGFMAFLGLFGSTGATQPCEPVQGTAQGTAPTNLELSQAIKLVTYDQLKDPRLTLSMLGGGHLESKWDPLAVGVGSYGIYQIQHPAGAPISGPPVHPDITVAQALNPAYSTNYMLPAYVEALSTVDPAMWTIDPVRAMDLTIFGAERPAEDYMISRSTDVRAAFTASVAEMKRLGIPTTFAFEAVLPTAPGAQPQPGSSNSTTDDPSTADTCGIASAGTVPGGGPPNGTRIDEVTTSLPDCPYTGPSGGRQGSQPGVTSLAAYLDNRFNSVSYGIFSCRTIAGSSTMSLHSEGRAYDAAFNAYDPTQDSQGTAAFEWIVANSTDIGVQEVIWKNKIWTPSGGMGSYSAMNHYNHVHVGLNWDGALARTPFFTGGGE